MLLLLLQLAAVLEGNGMPVLLLLQLAAVIEGIGLPVLILMQLAVDLQGLGMPVMMLLLGLPVRMKGEAHLSSEMDHGC